MTGIVSGLCNFAYIAPILPVLFINEIKNVKFKKTIQTISCLPHFLSWVILLQNSICALFFF